MASLRPAVPSRAARRALRDALADLDRSTSIEAWTAAATRVDELTGALAWRATAVSGLGLASGIDLPRLRDDAQAFARLRAEGDHHGLAASLHDALHRHLGDLAAPMLWHGALTGTKHVITDFLQACERAIDWLTDAPVPGLTDGERLRRFDTSLRTLGRSALMLSGGATLGFVHLGVVRALHSQGLLPSVLSGSSIGAMVAAGIASRTPTELTELFEDPTAIARQGVAWLHPREAMERGHLLDPAAMLSVVRRNCGELTFAEAYARSGRTLCISVSPTRRHQKPRVLSHLTSPHVLLPHAALASSAIPGFFPPAELVSRAPGSPTPPSPTVGDGPPRATVPYQPGEAWIDGTMHGDLPKRRLMRLFNVNQFLVSQTNPHVLPFFADPRRQGPLARLAGFTALRLLRRPAGKALSLLAHVTADTPARPATTMAKNLVVQDYSGDIDLHPRFEPRRLTRLLANPSRADLAELVLEGERATWPHLARIAAQTQIERSLQRARTRVAERMPRDGTST